VVSDGAHNLNCVWWVSKSFDFSNLGWFDVLKSCLCGQQCGSGCFHVSVSLLFLCVDFY
jgi:hypothetical protein